MEQRALGLVAVLWVAGCLQAPSLTIGTTTTVQDTGLLDVLLPAFHDATGLRARAVVAGSGEVIEKARRADVDVLLTHSPEGERSLVAEGVALERRPVMHSWFLLAGPADDPADTTHAATASDALRRIHDASMTFVSRGDASGTHEKELALWKAAGLDPDHFDPTWYRETGAGQGATLLVADEFDAYVLTDEPTLLQFHGRAGHTVPLFREDPALRNEYAVTLLAPARLPAPIHAEAAQRFADWLTTTPGSALIANYTIGGVRVFVPETHGAEGAQ